MKPDVLHIGNNRCEAVTFMSVVPVRYSWHVEWNTEAIQHFKREIEGHDPIGGPELKLI